MIGTILIVCVDDIIVIDNDVMKIEGLKKHLGAEAEIEDVNDLMCFLGIEIVRSSKWLTVLEWLQKMCLGD